MEKRRKWKNDEIIYNAHLQKPNLSISYIMYTYSFNVNISDSRLL